METWFEKEKLEYKGITYTPKEAIDSVLNFLCFIEDNTNYEIKEISNAIDELQRIKFTQKLFGIKDCFADTKCKCGELQEFITYTPIPQRYINSNKSYRNAYYFTTEDDCKKFAEELWQNYKGGK